MVSLSDSTLSAHGWQVVACQLITCRCFFLLLHILSLLPSVIMVYYIMVLCSRYNPLDIFLYMRKTTLNSYCFPCYIDILCMTHMKWYLKYYIQGTWIPDNNLRKVIIALSLRSERTSNNLTSIVVFTNTGHVESAVNSNINGNQHKYTHVCVDACIVQ